MIIKFLPSEIARLVLGYLKDSNCPRSWETFLTESCDLQEYYRVCQEEGDEYIITVLEGKSLIEILQDYRRLKDELLKKNGNHPRQENATTSNTDVFKTSRKSNENAFFNYKVNQKTRTQSTVASLHYSRSREKLSEPPENVAATPKRMVKPGQSKRLQDVHSTHLNLDNSNETSFRGETSCSLSAETLRTPGRNVSTSWTFKSTTPSRRNCLTDPARRIVNFFPRTPESKSLSRPGITSEILSRQPAGESSVNDNPEKVIENLDSNINTAKADEISNNTRLSLENSDTIVSDGQSSFVNKSIVVRSSEVTATDGNVTITTMKRSVTPQYQCEPPPYNRAPGTDSPRIILSYDRSQVPSLSTPMKDRRSWTEDFASPKRKGFIPRRRLVSESPISKQISTNDPTFVLPELGFSLLEDFFTTQPLAQRIADNINKVLGSDEPSKDPECSNSVGFPSLQDIHGSEEVIKDALARTEADPMFEECISFLYSSRELDEINATHDSATCAVEGNTANIASDSILPESSLRTPSPPVPIDSNSEVPKDKIDVSIEIEETKEKNNIIEVTSENTEKTPDATNKIPGSKSISNTSNANNIKSYADSNVASESEIQNCQVIGNLTSELKAPNPTHSVDVLDSCMSIIQPDSDVIAVDNEKTEPNSSVEASASEYIMEIEDKTIKQVPIGTPCQLETQIVVSQTPGCGTVLNQITPTSFVQSPNVSVATTQVTNLQNSQSTNVTLIPAVQNTSHTFPTSTFQPTQFLILPPISSNPFNQSYGIMMNTGNNWYCGNNTLNSGVMPVQNFPTILPSHTSQNTTSLQSMPVVDLSPNILKCSPTKTFSQGISAPLENVGNFVTVPANVFDAEQKNVLNKKKQAKALSKKKSSKVAPSKIKKAKEKIKKTKTKKKLRPSNSPSKDVLENIVNEEIGEFPVLSIPDPSPGKSCSLSAIELFSRITENKSPQSPFLEEVLSRAKLLAARRSPVGNSKHVRTLDFNSQCPKQNPRDKSKSPKLPIHVVSPIEKRRSSPRLKNKTSCKSPYCSPSKATQNCPLDKKKAPDINKIQPTTKTCFSLGKASEHKSPRRNVSMKEAVLVAMDQAVQTKALSKEKDKDISKDESAENEFIDKAVEKIDSSLDPQSKSPVKSGEITKEISNFFPSTLTESDSDSDLVPLSSLLSKNSQELTNIENSKGSKRSDKPKEDSITSKVKKAKENCGDAETVTLSPSPGDSVNPIPNKNKKGKRQTSLKSCKKRPPARETQSSKNLNKTSKPVNSLSSKSNDTKSANKIDNSSSGEDCDEKQLKICCVNLIRLNVEEISPKSNNSANEIKADESPASGIQKGKEKTQGLVDTEITPDENASSEIQKIEQNTQKDLKVTQDNCKLSEDVILPVKTFKTFRRPGFKEENKITKSVKETNEYEADSRNKSQSCLEISASKKLKVTKEATGKKKIPSNEKSCLDDISSNTVMISHASEALQSNDSLKSTEFVEEFNKGSPRSGKRKKDSSKNISKDNKKSPSRLLTNIMSEEPKQSPEKSLPAKMAKKLSEPQKSLQKHEKVKQSVSELSNEVPILKDVSSDESINIPEDKMLKSLSIITTVTEKNPNKKSSLPEPNISLSSEASKIAPFPTKKILPPPKKRIRPVPVTSPSDGGFSPFSPFSSPAHVSSADMATNSGVKAPTLTKDVNFSLASKSKAKNDGITPSFHFTSPVHGLSADIARNSKAKAPTVAKDEASFSKTSKSKAKDDDFAPFFPLSSPAHVSTPDKEKACTVLKDDVSVSQTSKSKSKDGDFSPFSHFSPPAHVSTAVTAPNSGVSAPTLAKDDMNVSQTSKSKALQNRLKLSSGKPKAMTEFYKAALPERISDLPISPGSISSSSCTIDSFLARKMLTGSCAKNASVKMNIASEASESLGVNESPKKLLSANNLKFMFSDQSSLFSPAKIPHNILYPSSVFPFLDHNESIQADDNSLLNASLKKDSKNFASMPIFLQNSHSKVDAGSFNPHFSELSESTKTADESLEFFSKNNFKSLASTPLISQKSSNKKDAGSSEKDSLIGSSIDTAVSATKHIQISSQLNPRARHRRKSSPMKAIITNEMFPTSSQKSNQNNDVCSLKKKNEKGTSAEVSIFSSKDVNPVESSQLPPQLNTSKDSESSIEEGLITSPVKTCKQTKRKLSVNPKIEQPSKKQILGLTNNSKSPQNPSVCNLLSKNSKPKSLLKRKVEPTSNISTGLSSNYEPEHFSDKISLGNEEFSSKFLHNSPDYNPVSFNTKSQTIHQAKSQQCLMNRVKASFNSETGELSKTISLDHTKLSSRLLQNSPIRCVDLSSTKPKLVHQRKSELNPKIPAGVKIPSDWNTSKISSYSTAIEKSRKNYDSNNSKRPRESSRLSSFPSPNKVPYTSSSAKKLSASHSNMHRRTRVSPSPRKYERGHTYMSNRFKHSEPSYRNSPKKYFKPFNTVYNIRRKNTLSVNIMRKELENFSKASASKSDRTSKVKLHSDENIKEESSTSLIHKDKSKNIAKKDRAVKNNNEKTDHPSKDCETKSIVDSHEGTSPCTKSVCQVTTEKSDILVNATKNESALISTFPNEETNKVRFESNTSPTVLVQMQLTNLESGNNIDEPVHEFCHQVEEPRDIESRTSADQSELNEAVAFLTNGNMVESQGESNVVSSSARTTYDINVVNEPNSSSSDNVNKHSQGESNVASSPAKTISEVINVINEPDSSNSDNVNKHSQGESNVASSPAKTTSEVINAVNEPGPSSSYNVNSKGVVPGGVACSKPATSNKEYIQYIVRKISERGGFRSLLQSLQRKE